MKHNKLQIPLKFFNFSPYPRDYYFHLTFPNSLKHIGSHCFCGGKLASLTLPPNLESIGSDSFVASILEENTYIVQSKELFEKHGEYLDSRLDEYIKKCSEDTYRHDVINGFHIFTPHYKNQVLEIPPSLSHIGKGSFANCEFDWLYVDPNNQSFKSDDGGLYTADGKCLLLWPKAVHVPSPFYLGEGVELNPGCFLKTDVSEVVLPQTLTEIPDYVFDSALYLKSVQIPNSVVRIGKGAFREYTSTPLSYDFAIIDSVDMKSNFCKDEPFVVNIPEKTVEIGDSAFYGRIVNTSFSPDCHLSYLGHYSFSNYREIELPNTMRIDVMGRWPFDKKYAPLQAETVENIKQMGSVYIQGSTKIGPETEFIPYHPLSEDAEAFYMSCGTDAPNGTMSLPWDRPLYIQVNWYWVNLGIGKMGDGGEWRNDCLDYWKIWGAGYHKHVGLPLFNYDKNRRRDKVCQTIIVPRGCRIIYINRGWGQICNEVVEGDYEPCGPQPFREDLVNLKNDWRIFHDSDFVEKSVGIEDITHTSPTDSYYYTIDGVRVHSPKTGHLYIHKGKKVIY